VEVVVAWSVLILSGLLEAVWAVALGRSEGLSRPVPSLVFVVGLVLSMGGLAYAMRSLPIGTAYAVWVGIGAALTVGFGMATGAESASPLKVLLIVGLVGCVVGLKLSH
jgi:quaternary ammonium compound-resistance protein SugE